MSMIAMTAAVSLMMSALSVATAPAEETAWIVETAPGAVAAVASAAENLAGENAITFDEVFSGVAVELTAAEAGMLDARPDVIAVHPDTEMTLLDTQNSAPWHLSRLDQATAPADSGYTYPTSAGAGVRVYIVDSGVSPNADQLGSRLLPGTSTVVGYPATADCNGHGSHVAGIAASTTWGVAKRALVVPVRVFDCSSSTSASTVIAGLDWIMANHPPGTPGVVNLSLAGESSPALDTAVQRLVSAGFVVAVAAGNGGADAIGDDACTQSPARVAGALTVGATTSTDARAGYSNFGPCLDLFAPGSSVHSLSASDPSASVVMSGTSMASPVVAGIAALAWGEAPGASARQIESHLLAIARSGAVGEPGIGSPNLLAASMPDAPPPALGASQPIPVYRFYSEANRSHFYTTSSAERDFLIQNFSVREWRYEGTAFTAFDRQAPSSMPIYRFYSETRRAHFYTSSAQERDHLIATFPVTVWRYEGVAFWANPVEGGETTPIHRFYSPSTNTHFYTASDAEAAYIRQTFADSVWRYEGLAFRVPAG